MNVLGTRPLTAGDVDLLKVATLGNLNWLGQRYTMHDVESRPEFAHYAHVDPDRGDFGLVIERDHEVRGVAWALFLSAQDPGFGFIDPETPEVSIWIHPDERGHGLGKQLLRSIKIEAHARGVRALSLSVEEGNYARRLYKEERFIDVPGRERDGVMIWTAEQYSVT